MMLLTNDYHGTETQVHPRKGYLTHRQMLKSRAILCGYDLCECGDIAGSRPSQVGDQGILGGKIKEDYTYEAKRKQQKKRMKIKALKDNWIKVEFEIDRIDDTPSRYVTVLNCSKGEKARKKEVDDYLSIDWSGQGEVKILNIQSGPAGEGEMGEKEENSFIGKIYKF